MAWYDRDGETTSRNPFKKFRRHPRRSDSINLETGLAPVSHHHSNPAGPEEHADALSSYQDPLGLDQITVIDSTENLKPKSSAARSTDPINVSTCEENNDNNENDSPDSNKPRRRKTALGNFGARTASADDDDTLIHTESAKSPVEKQRFTAMGQLKATLFNSWINVLLVAAPVGSE